jgi:hypothetical protein
MSQASARGPLGPIQYGIIALAIATALIHILLALGTSDITTKIMFTLNGLGYIALVAALYLPRFAAHRRIIRWALMAFAAVTLLGWVVIGERNAVAYVDKAIEVALIVLLWLEHRQQAALE